MLIFKLSASAEALASTNPHATVEAEYGSVTVRGSLVTFAHHGANAGNPCPCSYGNDAALDHQGKELVVGLSHIDLDTIGGCMALMGSKPEAPDFWKAAEFIDLNGVHKLEKCPEATPEVRAQLDAWYAWSGSNKVYPPRVPSQPSLDLSILVDNVSYFVGTAASMLILILSGDTALLEQGRRWAAEQASLNADSFAGWEGTVMLRRADKFVNHLYAPPPGLADRECQALVAFNDKTKDVTLSFPDGVPPGCPNAREFVQGMWGPLAGGHDCIAGSPRDRELTFEDAAALAMLVQRMLCEPNRIAS